jgi:5-methylcytosine-specific restriction endonuclease McrA
MRPRQSDPEPRELSDVRLGDFISTLIPARPPLPDLTEPPKRTPIPADIQTEVWERDDYRCVRCGAVSVFGPPELRTNPLGIDHIFPVSLGGSNDVDNLQVLCRSCNSQKGTKWPG